MENISQHTNPKEYKVQIAKNSCYDIFFDGLKNRIYFTIHGFWKNRDGVSEFLNDWKKALSMAESEFTILTDMRTMITHPQELTSLHHDAHNLVLDAGVKNVAHVMPQDKIAYLQVQSIHEKTYLPTKSFHSFEEADQWLDIVAISSSN